MTASLAHVTITRPGGVAERFKAPVFVITGGNANIEEFLNNSSGPRYKEKCAMRIRRNSIHRSGHVHLAGLVSVAAGGLVLVTALAAPAPGSARGSAPPGTARRVRVRLATRVVTNPSSRRGLAGRKSRIRKSLSIRSIVRYELLGDPTADQRFAGKRNSPSAFVP